MLRACLQQRLRTTLRTFRNVHGAEAAGGASTLSTRKSLSMGADNALRNMERQMLKAKLHVAQLLKELTGEDAKTRVDLATKADHIRDLYSRVCQAYQTLREYSY